MKAALPSVLLSRYSADANEHDLPVLAREGFLREGRKDMAHEEPGAERQHREGSWRVHGASAAAAPSRQTPIIVAGVPRLPFFSTAPSARRRRLFSHWRPDSLDPYRSPSHTQ